MHEDPVCRQFGRCNAVADGDLNNQARFTGSTAAVHAAARRGLDPELDQRRGELPIVLCHDLSRAFDPAVDRLLLRRGSAVFHEQAHGGVPDLEGSCARRASNIGGGCRCRSRWCGGGCGRESRHGDSGQRQENSGYAK
jgi:hypothetical protein